MVIHRFIHTCGYLQRYLSHGMAVRPLWEYSRPCREMDGRGYVQIVNAVLQRFSARRTGMSPVREGKSVLKNAGWRRRLRIYSRRSTEYFGAPVEEFNEAYLSAKSP